MSKPVEPGDLFLYTRHHALYIVTEPYGAYGGQMRGWVLRPLHDTSDWCWDEERHLLDRTSPLWRRVE